MLMEKNFYICLALKPYKEDQNKFRGLIRELNDFGIMILDAEEAPLVDRVTNKTVFETLMLLCSEVRDGAMEDLAKDMRRQKGTEHNIYEYNGLPMVMQGELRLALYFFFAFETRPSMTSIQGGIDMTVFGFWAIIVTAVTMAMVIFGAISMLIVQTEWYRKLLMKTSKKWIEDSMKYYDEQEDKVE